MLTESSLSVFQWVCVSFGRFIVGGRWPVPEPIPPDLLAVWFICSLLIRIGGKLPKHCFHSHMAFFGVLSSLRTWALIAANSSFARCLIDSQAVASINQKRSKIISRSLGMLRFNWLAAGRQARLLRRQTVKVELLFCVMSATGVSLFLFSTPHTSFRSIPHLFSLAFCILCLMHCCSGHHLVNEVPLCFNWHWWLCVCDVPFLLAPSELSLMASCGKLS